MNTTKNALILAKCDRVRSGFHALLASLPDCGHVTQTDDLRLALEDIAQHQPKLVLIDFELAGVKLQSWLDQIKHAAPQAQCLVLAANPLQQHLAGATDAAAVLMKGFRAAEFIKAVEKLMSKNTQSQGGNVLLETRQLTKLYAVGQEEIQALREVDFQAKAGDFVVINGPSGSGKSTFLNLIALIDQPTSGEVFLEGQPMSRLGSNELADLRRDKVGLMFQAFNLIPVLSAFENVEYPLLLKGVPARQRRERVLELLASVGLEQEAGRRPDQLSGGQKQRIALARTLANRPKIILADEPTGNLDSKTGETVMELMRTLNQEQQVTFIVVTHDPRVNPYASRVVHIRDGALSEQVVERPANAVLAKANVKANGAALDADQVKEGRHVVSPSLA